MGSEDAGKQLIWFDRSGKEIERVGSHDSANLWMWSLSPDGRRVALGRTVQGNFDVWLLEARRGILTRFTTDPAMDWAAVWSPDGGRIAYRHDGHLYARSVDDAAGAGTSLLSSTAFDTPTDWSIDGRSLVFQRPIRRRVWICGPCRLIAMEDRARPSSSRTLTPLNSTGNSRPMESGSRTSRTSQARPRFTSSHSRARDRSRESLPMAVFRCDGDWMVGSCSTWPPTAASWPFRFVLVRVAPPSNQVQPSPSSGPICRARHNPIPSCFRSTAFHLMDSGS